MLQQVFYRRIIILVLIAMPLIGNAQNFFGNIFNDRYFSTSIGIGRNGYNGELNHGKLLATGIRNLNLGFEARLYDHVGARVELTFFGLKGNDTNAADSSFARQRNLSFQSNNIEFNLQGIFYLNKYSGKYHKRRTWDPFVAVGVGVMRYNPYAKLGGEKLFLRKYETEGLKYGKYSLVIPAGIGFKGRVTKFMNVIFEAGYRVTFTDYLDDVSNVYGGPYDNLTQELLSNRKDEIPLVNVEAYDQMVPGGRRGDPGNNDHYWLAEVKLEFFLPINVR